MAREVAKMGDVAWWCGMTSDMEYEVKGDKDYDIDCVMSWHALQDDDVAIRGCKDDVACKVAGDVADDMALGWRGWWRGTREGDVARGLWGMWHMKRQDD